MWCCERCSEEIDDVFDACWKCGTSRDGTADENFVPADSIPREWLVNDSPPNPSGDVPKPTLLEKAIKGFLICAAIPIVATVAGLVLAVVIGIDALFAVFLVVNYPSVVAVLELSIRWGQYKPGWEVVLLLSCASYGVVGCAGSVLFALVMRARAEDKRTDGPADVDT
jgi:hypothetical protein